MKLEDIIALAKQGYKVNDIKELMALGKEEPIEPTGEGKDEPTDGVDPTEDKEKSTFISTSAPVEPKPVSDDDAVDYKSMYEDTLKKLETVQKANVSRNVEPKSAKSEEELLQDIARKFM